MSEYEKLRRQKTEILGKQRKVLTQAIYDKLAMSGSFRETLPKHIDRDKFEHLVIADIDEVLSSHWG